MLKWISKMEGNASKPREAARKVVHPETELLDEPANGEALVPRATRKGPGATAGVALQKRV
jgi:hypothetical protein